MQAFFSWVVCATAGGMFGIAKTNTNGKQNSREQTGSKTGKRKQKPKTLIGSAK